MLWIFHMKRINDIWFDVWLLKTYCLVHQFLTRDILSHQEELSAQLDKTKLVPTSQELLRT